LYALLKSLLELLDRKLCRRFKIITLGELKMKRQKSILVFSLLVILSFLSTQGFAHTRHSTEEVIPIYIHGVTTRTPNATLDEHYFKSQKNKFNVEVQKLNYHLSHKTLFGKYKISPKVQDIQLVDWHDAAFKYGNDIEFKSFASSLSSKGQSEPLAFYSNYANAKLHNFAYDMFWLSNDQNLEKAKTLLRNAILAVHREYGQDKPFVILAHSAGSYVALKEVLWAPDYPEHDHHLYDNLRGIVLFGSPVSNFMSNDLASQKLCKYPYPGGAGRGRKGSLIDRFLDGGNEPRFWLHISHVNDIVALPVFGTHYQHKSPNGGRLINGIFKPPTRFFAPMLIPITSHSSYWKDPLLFSNLIEKISNTAVVSDSKNPDRCQP
jgi:hypothetical protein